MSEPQLKAIGVPLGPRIRIIQELHKLHPDPNLYQTPAKPGPNHYQTPAKSGPDPTAKIKTYAV